MNGKQTKWALGIALGSAVAFAPAVQAFGFEGTWPEPDATVSVNAVNEPASQVVERIAKAAKLDVAATLPEDPRVTVRLTKQPVRAALEAVLGGLPVTVTRSGNLLLVRPEAAPAAPSAPPGTASPAGDAAAPTAPGAEAAPGDGAATPPTRTGPVLGERVRFGDDITVGAEERVEAVASFGGDVELLGEVTGDVASMGGDVVVRPGAVVRGDIASMGGDVEVEAGASVEGDIVPLGGDLVIAPGAHAREGTRADVSIHGIDFKVESDKKKRGRHHDDDDDRERWAEDYGALHVAGNAAKFGVLFLFGLLLLGVAPAKLDRVRDTLRDRPLMSGLRGFLSPIVFTLMVLVLVVTVIGIPVAILLALCVPVVVAAGLVVAAYFLGGVLPVVGSAERPVRALALGFGLLFAVSLVPGLGTLGVVLAALFGVGAILTSRRWRGPHGPWARHRSGPGGTGAGEPAGPAASAPPIDVTPRPSDDAPGEGGPPAATP